jgi:hypothetical protein
VPGRVLERVPVLLLTMLERMPVLPLALVQWPPENSQPGPRPRQHW